MNTAFRANKPTLTTHPVNGGDALLFTITPSPPQWWWRAMRRHATADPTLMRPWDQEHESRIAVVCPPLDELTVVIDAVDAAVEAANRDYEAELMLQRESADRSRPTRPSVTSTTATSGARSMHATTAWGWRSREMGWSGRERGYEPRRDDPAPRRRLETDSRTTERGAPHRRRAPAAGRQPGAASVDRGRQPAGSGRPRGRCEPAGRRGTRAERPQFVDGPGWTADIPGRPAHLGSDHHLSPPGLENMHNRSGDARAAVRPHRVRSAPLGPSHGCAAGALARPEVASPAGSSRSAAFWDDVAQRRTD
jgi:hypothetical protein